MNDNRSQDHSKTSRKKRLKSRTKAIVRKQTGFTVLPLTAYYQISSGKTYRSLD